MMRDYPKQDQRLAVCFSQFRSRKIALSKEELAIVETAIEKGKQLQDQLGKVIVIAQIQEFKDTVANAEIHVLDDFGNVIEIIKQKIKKTIQGLKKK